MTSPFQFIIDDAQDIEFNEKAVVASTMSRNQTARATSRGGRIYRFIVTPPGGLRWTESRGLIAKLMKADTFTVDTIDFSSPNSTGLFGYQGNVVGTQSISFTQGSDTVVVTGGTISSGFRFKGGDFIQPLGSDRVYTVVNDVPFNSTSVLLNRPVLDATGSSTLLVGQDCKFKVLCTSMPNYKLVSYDRIEWSGTFTFIESLA